MADLDVRAFAEAVGTVMDYGAGDIVYREGDDARYMYVVLSGAVDVISHDRMLETVDEGKALGIVSLLDEQKRTTTARVSTPTRLALLDRKKFRYMVEEIPNFGWYVMAELAHRLRATNAAL